MNRLDDLMPNFWDNDFEPLSCGIIEIWKDSSRMEYLKLYSGTAAKDNELRNPYHLTSAGRPLTPVYFEENGAFVVVKNKDGVEIKSYEYETSSVLQGGLSVQEDVEAGRNLESAEDTKVGRNLAVEKDAIVKGDISANNAAIANKTATKDIEVANHTETKTLKAENAEISGILNIESKVKTKDLDATGKITAGSFESSGGAKADSLAVKKETATATLEVSGTATVQNLVVNGNANINTAGGPLAVASNTTNPSQTDLPVGSYILAELDYGHQAANRVVDNNSTVYPVLLQLFSGGAYRYLYEAFLDEASIGYRTRLAGTWRSSGQISDVIRSSGNTSSAIFCRRVS